MVWPSGGITDKLPIPKSTVGDIISDSEDMRAYLRGLFMTCGSVNDPKKSRYHLEFLVDNEEYGKFLVKILNAKNVNIVRMWRIVKYGSKFLWRRNHYYF